MRKMKRAPPHGASAIHEPTCGGATGFPLPHGEGKRVPPECCSGALEGVQARFPRGARKIPRREEASSCHTEGSLAAALDVKIVALQVFRKADEEHRTASGTARTTTGERDKAFGPVNVFRNSVMKMAWRVFRKEPEQFAKLDF